MVVALAGGATHAAAAKKAGVTVRTVQRWLAEPEFVARVSEARHTFFDTAFGKLAASAGDAADALAALLADPSPGIRLRACQTVLQAVPSWREHMELAERLAALEAAVAANGGQR